MKTLGVTVITLFFGWSLFVFPPIAQAADPIIDPKCNSTTQLTVRDENNATGYAACCTIGTTLSRNFTNYDQKGECVKPLGFERVLSHKDFNDLLANGEIAYAQTCGSDYVSTQDLTTGKYQCYLKKADLVCGGRGWSFNTNLQCCINNSLGRTPTHADCNFDLRECPNPNFKIVNDGTKLWCAPDTAKLKILSGSFKSADIEGDCGGGGDPDAPTRFIDTAIGCIPVDSLQNTLGFALKWIFLAAGGIIVVMVIKNGFTLLTSSGNPEKLKEVRESVVAIITGVLLIVFSLTILKVVGADILGLPGF